MLLIFNPAETAKPPTDPVLPVPPHGARGPGHLAFAATGRELYRWRERLVAAGVAIEADFRWPGSGARSIYVRDPAGNSVEFTERRLWGFGEQHRCNDFNALPVTSRGRRRQSTPRP